MSEQAINDSSAADTEGVESEQTSAHDHVRTDGEMNVDDAIGGADDPQ